MLNIKGNPFGLFKKAYKERISLFSIVNIKVSRLADSKLRNIC